MDAGELEGDELSEPVSSIKWDADRRGLSAFKSTKAGPKKRGGAAVSSSSTLASEDLHAASDKAAESEAGEGTALDASDILARLAAEALEIDGFGEEDNGGAARRSRRASAAANDVSRGAESQAASSRMNESDDIGSPLAAADSPRWQGMNEKPLESLRRAGWRSATVKLLRSLDGEEEGEGGEEGEEGGGEGDEGLGDSGVSHDGEGSPLGGRGFFVSARGSAAADPPDEGSGQAVYPGTGGEDDGGSMLGGEGGGMGGTAGPGLGLAHPDVHHALFKIAAAEERLKAREAALAAKETAVAQLDARQRMVHQLRQQLDDRDKIVKRREVVLAGREARYESELRAASATDRARLARLIEEGEALVRKLKVELPAREAAIEERVESMTGDLRAREADLEPRFTAVARREADAAADAAAMTRALAAKEAELVATMIAARDVFAVAGGGPTGFRRAGTAHAAPAARAAEEEALPAPASPLFSLESEEGVPGRRVPGMDVAEAALAAGSLDSAAGTAPALPDGPLPDPVADPLGWLNNRIAHHTASLVVSRAAMEVEAERERKAREARAGARPLLSPTAGWASPPPASRAGALVGGSVGGALFGGLASPQPHGGRGGYAAFGSPAVGGSLPSLSTHVPSFRTPGVGADEGLVGRVGLAGTGPRPGRPAPARP